MGRRKRKAAEAATAAAEAVETVLVDSSGEKQKGSFFKKLLFVGVLAGIGFAVYKGRQATM